jgi:hypothetical protein
MSQDKGPPGPTNSYGVPIATKAERAQAKLKERQARNDVRVVMGTQEGRRFVWRVIEKANIAQGQMMGEPHIYFHRGMEYMAKHLEEIINESDASLFVQMFTENYRKENTQ